MNQDHKVSFRLDQSLYTLLTTYAKKYQVKPSVIIRDALAFYFLSLREAEK